MSQYAHYSEPSPDLAAALATVPPGQMFGDIQQVRVIADEMLKASIEAAKKALPPKSTYSVQDYKVPVDGGEILVRAVTPTPIEGEDGTFPLLVWYHGGGWALGDVDQNDAMLRAMSVKLRMSTLNVEYRYRSELLSIEQNKDAPVLSKQALLKFQDWLGAPPDHPHFSILLHPAHAKAPPAYLQISGQDPLRDEGILYAKVLKEAGVTVQYDVYVLCFAPSGLR
ncbi:hypothetical protein NLI96_g4024 [Meripilus lineatus]|uniref:Alpha/beta hydrolase fold-3 domain-containing protein n=1 Tax=Meripilus lineatus TaxID=2056292 RepID=A0AAD5YKB2_9APHY|nr:hypothetical protein NLI96_g4024 [Physisporinus lineatus]